MDMICYVILHYQDINITKKKCILIVKKYRGFENNYSG